MAYQAMHGGRTEHKHLFADTQKERSLQRARKTTRNGMALKASKHDITLRWHSDEQKIWERASKSKRAFSSVVC